MAAIASKDGTIPALADALVTIRGAEFFSLDATDLIVSASSMLVSENKGEGSFSVNAKLAYDRVASLAGDSPVTITYDGNEVVIKCGSRVHRLACRDGSEFPRLPSVGETRTSAFPALKLLAAFSSVAPAISADESRIHLASMLLEVSGDLVRCVATDGHRLGIAEFDDPEHTIQRGSVLIPSRGAMELRAFLRDCIGEGDTIGISRDHIFICHECDSISVRLVDAKFPPYLQVIPANLTGTISVLRAEALDSIRSVAASAGKNSGMKFSVLKIKDESVLRLECESPDVGSSSDTLPTSNAAGEIVTGVNARYLADAISASTSTAETEIQFGAELDPIVIVPVSPQTVRTKAVIMPMRM